MLQSLAWPAARSDERKGGASYALCPLWPPPRPQGAAQGPAGWGCVSDNYVATCSCSPITPTCLIFYMTPFPICSCLCSAAGCCSRSHGGGM